MTSKTFDLNIEEILENWETQHAVREVVANALDERVLTGTSEILIEKRNLAWFIRDFGRGLRYTHLTQNENQEKLANPNVIGRFGIGLKDALATFERHGVDVTIRSRFGVIKTTKMVKQGFGDVVTLHAVIEAPLDTDFVGTEFELRGVSDVEIEAAKNLFLMFSTEPVLETARYGQVIKRSTGPGHIYINGVKVAEEENFLFSYNITLLSAAIKKAINRERSHVGRTAYADSVKKILLASSNPDIAESLANDVAQFQGGMMHDELAWVDVQEHAIKILNTQGSYLLVTAAEAMRNPNLMDQARNGGRTILTIPENLKAKISNSTDNEGNPIVGIAEFTQEYNDSFIFHFLAPHELTSEENAVFELTSDAIEIFGGRPSNVRSIRVSTTMRQESGLTTKTLGCWDEKTGSIVILREALFLPSQYFGVLLHELVHAKTGAHDVTRDFEGALTMLIGNLCQRLQKTLSALKAHEISSNQVVTVMAAVDPLPTPMPSYILGTNKILSDAVETAVIEKNLALKRVAQLSAELTIARANEERTINNARILDRDLATLRNFSKTSTKRVTDPSAAKHVAPWYKFW